MDQIYTAAQFLDAVTCRHLIEVFHAGPSQRQSAERLLTRTSVRESKSVRVEYEDMPEIFDRITTRIDQIYRVVTHLAQGSSMLLQYPLGSGVGWHADDEYFGDGRIPRSTPRFIVFTVILNHAFEGGDLLFANGVSVRPTSPGMLVAWPATSSFDRCIRPVRAGERFALAGVARVESPLGSVRPPPA